MSAVADNEADSPDLEALFDSIVEANATPDGVGADGAVGG